jgi:hypothetical protein
MTRSISTLALLAFVGSASAQIFNTTDTTVITPFSTTWYTSGNSGGGNSEITGYTGIDGDGAALIQGDRTRFAIGNMFPSAAFPEPNVGRIADLTNFNFQWNTVQLGAGVQSAQAPAFRVHVYDPQNQRRIEFNWEDGEQSTPQFVNGAGSLETVYQGDFFAAGSRVYPFTGGLGRGLFDAGNNLIQGSDSAQSLASLLATLAVNDAFITGLSVGVGSSVGADYLGYADQINFTVAGGADFTVNFVPTPASAAILGFAGLAAARRRR